MCERSDALVAQLNRQTEMIGKLVRQLEGARHLVVELRRRMITKDLEIDALRATVADVLVAPKSGGR